MSCPFYGYNGMVGLLIHTGGNQCGLKVSSHAPCVMEMEGDEPDSNTCPYITQVILQGELLKHNLPKEDPRQ